MKSLQAQAQQRPQRPQRPRRKHQPPSPEQQAHRVLSQLGNPGILQEVLRRMAFAEPHLLITLVETAEKALNRRISVLTAIKGSHYGKQFLYDYKIEPKTKQQPQPQPQPLTRPQTKPLMAQRSAKPFTAAATDSKQVLTPASVPSPVPSPVPGFGAPQKPMPLPAQLARVAWLVSQGRSHAYIAEQIGVQPYQVTNCLRRLKRLAETRCWDSIYPNLLHKGLIPASALEPEASVASVAPTAIQEVAPCLS